MKRLLTSFAILQLIRLGTKRHSVVAQTCPDDFTGVQHRMDCRIMLWCVDGSVAYRYDCGEGEIYSMKHNSCRPKHDPDVECITRSPTAAPTTATPSARPSLRPSAAPTGSPTATPTENPTWSPTSAPTHSPTRRPTAQPSLRPTASPSASPTTLVPTLSPSSSSDSLSTDQMHMQSCPQNFNGLKSANNCRSYLWCVDGDVFFGPMDCPRGMKFFLRSQACDYPNNYQKFHCL